LVREVEEETGVTVDAGPLFYLAEVVDAVRCQDLELVFGAERGSLVRTDSVRLIDVLGGERSDVLPPILDEIARDAVAGWSGTPRWLGNLWRSDLART
jgi:8-oxo-dGTP pyrophosphatase MutT (NUDIX family)